MARATGTFRPLVSVLVLGLLGLAAAQFPSMPQVPQVPQPAAPLQVQLPMHVSSFAGTWRSVNPRTGTSEGLSSITINQIEANGWFRQTFYVGNQIAGYMEGYLTVQPNGVLTQVPMNWSPMYCAQAIGCVPYPAPSQVSVQVVHLALAAFVVVGQDVASGKPPVTSSWQRVTQSTPVAGAAPGGFATQNMPSYGTGGYGAYPGAGAGAYGGGAPGGGSYGPGSAGAYDDAESPRYDWLTPAVDALRGELPYTDGEGNSYHLPNVPDPNTNYYTPSGNALTYNDYTGGWSETDSMGWEVDIKPDPYE